MQPSLLFQPIHNRAILSSDFFSALNFISRNIKRAMYHLQQYDVGCKTFRIFCPTEVFFHLWSKIPSAIIAEMVRRETNTVYYDTLKMEAQVAFINKTYLRVMKKPTLDELRDVLGSGIGLGFCSSRPTKKNNLKCCMVNDKLNSIELGESYPEEYHHKPLSANKGNDIDFIFSEATRQLTCILRYSSIVISDAEVTISRLPSANVSICPETNAYVGAWFLHNGSVLEVVRISGNIVVCHDPDDEVDLNEIESPLNLVSDLVNSFGR